MVFGDDPDNFWKQAGGGPFEPLRIPRAIDVLLMLVNNLERVPGELLIASARVLFWEA